MRKILLKIVTILVSAFSLFAINFTYAKWDAWSIIPEDSKWWENAKDMTWTDVFKFFQHLATVLSQIWLVIWSLMVIYSWYKYASGVFTQDASKWWSDALKYAIYGVLVVIFSYAIMKLLLSVFL
jgi:hypothetical protein